DLLVLDRRDLVSAGADADHREIAYLQPGLGRPGQQQHVGRGPWRADAELHALDVGRALDLGRHVAAQADGDLHAAADQGEALDSLAALLHADGVLVGAGDDV